MWGKVGIPITDNLSKIIDDSEVVIEFTMCQSPQLKISVIASIRKDTICYWNNRFFKMMN